MSVRTVHAQCDGFKVVRDVRAGKWWVISSNFEREPERVGVAEAARRALSAETLGGQIHLGIAGGRSFDAWIRRLR